LNFNSLHFGLFYVVVFGLVAALGPRTRTRNCVLLLASYYFYGCWDWRFLGLIFATTVVDYFVGLALNVRLVDPAHAPPKTGRRRAILMVSLGTQLGVLAFFKYFNFFADNLVVMLHGLGIPIAPRTLDVILPVGVSFYTFQSMSYTIEVFRGRLATERSFLKFATYVGFFPQLVAGPIERAAHLLPQMSMPTRITGPMIRAGLYLIAWGLFKKVVLADNVAQVADAVFPHDGATGLDVLFGVYAFALQIYCDFSAYSDIARGVARCMGFDLMLNFNLPYFATNPSDFWQRWHISLSTWLRDYLYIPLGGNRRGPGRTYVNLVTTMVLGGLWHGAAWTFVAWGIYHGSLLCLHRLLSPLLDRLRLERLGGVWFWVRVVFFFHLVCVSWLLFRADDFPQAWRMLGALFTNLDGGLHVVGRYHLQTLFACWIALYAVDLLSWFRKNELAVLYLPTVVRGAVYAALFLGFLWFGEYGGESFIYFQF
jgi:D-alanyl-lipoteichoic acid acyltransferase DltB (MBOAT superfamily)